jgi:hypothetical protein
MNVALEHSHLNRGSLFSWRLSGSRPPPPLCKLSRSDILEGNGIDKCGQLVQLAFQTIKDQIYEQT